MWKMWEKMLFRCWKLSLWFCVNLLYKVRAWDARRCLYSNFNIWFLCGKCRLPWNIFKPQTHYFCNYVESVGLLQMLLRCYEELSLCGKWGPPWYAFKNHAKWYLQLCWKCGTPKNAFQMLKILIMIMPEDVKNNWVCLESAGLLKMLLKNRHIIFAIMLKVWDFFKCF